VSEARTGEYQLAKFASFIAGNWVECGPLGGRYAMGMLKRGAETVTVVATDPGFVERGRDRWAHEPRIRFVETPNGALPLGDELFDGIFLNHVIERTADDRALLREAARVLRPGGYAAVIAPSRRFPFERNELRVGRRVVRRPTPLVPWLPRAVSRRFTTARNYWPGEVARLLEETGFEVVSRSDVLPELVVHPWLPERLLEAYRRNLERLDASPLRRLGASTLVVGRRPA
jgi:ubiquinone/menaquinone biosynthesis C-methylase UbiE